MSSEKIFGYDVYYRLSTSSSVLVAASSVKEAKEKALIALQNMSRDELASRFLAALDFEPEFQITFVDKVDQLD